MNRASRVVSVVLLLVAVFWLVKYLVFRFLLSAP